MARSKGKGGSTAHKRTATQRKVDIAYIILLLKRCQSHEDITEAINKLNKGKYSLTRQMVSLDIAEAINELVARNSHNTIHARIVAAERQLEIANTARVEYERSCRLDQIKRVTEELKDKTDDGEVKKKRARTETTNRLGDPRYLAIMTSALAEHARLLGLYSQPSKDDIPLPGTQINQFAISVMISGGDKSEKQLRASDPHDIPRILDVGHTQPGKGKQSEEGRQSQSDSGGISIRPASPTT
jgi:hypothetical protein